MATASLDLEKAKRILFDEAAAAKTPEPSNSWHQEMKEISDLVDEENAPKTHLAMLATALLAKSTDARVDPFAIKAEDREGAYNARSISDQVLAPNVRGLKIHIGAMGAWPLNNSPYRGPATVREAGRQISGAAEKIYGKLVEILTRLEEADEIQARAALRAYIRERTYAPVAIVLPSGVAPVNQNQFVAYVSTFVAGSRFGQGAQAVAAGLLDQVHTGTVVTSAVNDPDRHFLGDVGIARGEDHSDLASTYEVKDKKVDESVVERLIQQAAEETIGKVAMVAVAGGQPPLDLSVVGSVADELGVAWQVFTSWQDFVRHCVFSAPGHPSVVLSEATRAILTRLEDMGAGSATQQTWATAAKAIFSH